MSRRRGMTSRESIAAALQAVPSGPQQVYRCSDCNAHGHWQDGWLWYGSWLHRPTRILCPKCSEPHRHEVIEP